MTQGIHGRIHVGIAAVFTGMSGVAVFRTGRCGDYGHILVTQGVHMVIHIRMTANITGIGGEAILRTGRSGDYGHILVTQGIHGRIHVGIAAVFTGMSSVAVFRTGRCGDHGNVVVRNLDDQFFSGNLDLSFGIGKQLVTMLAGIVFLHAVSGTGTVNLRHMVQHMDMLHDQLGIHVSTVTVEIDSGNFASLHLHGELTIAAVLDVGVIVERLRICVRLKNVRLDIGGVVNGNLNGVFAVMIRYEIPDICLVVRDFGFGYDAVKQLRNRNNGNGSAKSLAHGSYHSNGAFTGLQCFEGSVPSIHVIDTQNGLVADRGRLNSGRACVIGYGCKFDIHVTAHVLVFCTIYNDHRAGRLRSLIDDQAGFSRASNVACNRVSVDSDPVSYAGFQSIAGTLISVAHPILAGHFLVVCRIDDVNTYIVTIRNGQDIFTRSIRREVEVSKVAALKYKFGFLTQFDNRNHLNGKRAGSSNSRIIDSCYRQSNSTGLESHQLNKTVFLVHDPQHIRVIHTPHQLCVGAKERLKLCGHTKVLTYKYIQLISRQGDTDSIHRLSNRDRTVLISQITAVDHHTVCLAGFKVVSQVSIELVIVQLAAHVVAFTINDLNPIIEPAGRLINDVVAGLCRGEAEFQVGIVRQVHDIGHIQFHRFNSPDSHGGQVNFITVQDRLHFGRTAADALQNHMVTAILDNSHNSLIGGHDLQIGDRRIEITIQSIVQVELIANIHIGNGIAIVIKAEGFFRNVLCIDKGRQGNITVVGKGQFIGFACVQVIDITVPVVPAECILITQRCTVDNEIHVQLGFQLTVDPVQATLVGTEVVGHTLTYAETDLIPAVKFLDGQLTGNSDCTSALVAEGVGHHDLCSSLTDQQQGHTLAVAAADADHILIGGDIAGDQCVVVLQFQPEPLVHHTTHSSRNAEILRHLKLQREDLVDAGYHALASELVSHTAFQLEDRTVMVAGVIMEAGQRSRASFCGSKVVIVITVDEVVTTGLGSELNKHTVFVHFTGPLIRNIVAIFVDDHIHALVNTGCINHDLSSTRILCPHMESIGRGVHHINNTVVADIEEVVFKIVAAHQFNGYPQFFTFDQFNGIAAVDHDIGGRNRFLKHHRSGQITVRGSQDKHDLRIGINVDRTDSIIDSIKRAMFV